MEKPKCRLCGERHYGLCEFGGPSEHPASGGSSAGGEGIASRGKTADHRPQPVGDVTAKASGVVPDGREVGCSSESLKMEQARKPLTNAERQKRYRESNKEEYRRRNRERMRRKRNG